MFIGRQISHLLQNLLTLPVWQVPGSVNLYSICSAKFGNILNRILRYLMLKQNNLTFKQRIFLSH